MKPESTATRRTYDVKCTKCGHNVNVQDGTEMLYPEGSVLLRRRQRNGGYGSLMRSFIRNKNLQDETFGRMAKRAITDRFCADEFYLCTKCMGLTNGFYYKIKTDDETYEPDPSCSKCGIPLCRVKFKHNGDAFGVSLLRDDNVKKWSCPECGGDELRLDAEAASLFYLMNEGGYIQSDVSLQIPEKDLYTHEKDSFGERESSQRWLEQEDIECDIREGLTRVRKRDSGSWKT